MAGEARSLEFVIGSATVMVGDVNDLWQLNPDTHGLGLINNFAVVANPTFIDLAYTTGGNPIFSVLSDTAITATMNVYEATARNMSIALGQLPLSVETISDSYSLDLALSGSSYAFFQADTDVTTLFPAGSWIMIQEKMGDTVHVAQLTSNALALGSGPFNITVEFDNHPVAAGNYFSAGARVFRVNVLNLNPSGQPDYFSAKVVGESLSGSNSLAMIFPKVRIMRGFDLTFDATNFSSMPFSLRPQNLIPNDMAYDYFSDGSVAKLFSQKRLIRGFTYPTMLPTPIASIRLVTRSGRRILVRNGRVLGVRR